MEFMKENIVSVEKKNRSRGDNWTQEEKDLFMEIMGQSSSIIENKNTDTNTNKKKNLEWLKIQNKLTELTGKQRDLTQLRGFWRRTKVAAKKSISQHRIASRGTGGGQQPPSPPADDLKIMAMCPTDFIIEENKYDSDAVSQVTEQNKTMFDDEVCNSTIYDTDLLENAENEMEVSFVSEAVTNEEICDNEIGIKSYGGGTKTGNATNERKYQTKKEYPKHNPSKATLYGSNLEIKKQTMAWIEEEYKLKIKYQKQEICHQQLWQKLEIDLLMLDKEKKQLEIEVLKKKLQ